MLGLLGLAHRASLQLARGEPTAAESADRALAHLSRPFLSNQQRLPLLELRIEAALAAGDVPAAAQAAATALDEPTLDRAPRYAWPLLAATARALTATTPAPTDLLTRLHQRTATIPVRYPHEHANAADVTAELATSDDVVEARRAAVVAWRADGHPYGLARALVRLAEAAAGAGDRGAAEEAIAEATRVAGRLGAVPLRDQAALLARRLGLRSAPTAAPPPAAAVLTDREIEVLRLVAEGHSNRRIAEALYISPKTASVHVSHIIAKLAVSRRGEAAAVAHRLGLLATRAPDPA
jgi:DNA-binding CsgD family transcriptional regulator